MYEGSAKEAMFRLAESPEEAFRLFSIKENIHGIFCQARP